MARRDPNLRAFVKYDKNGDIVPGSLILRRKPPESGRSFHWQELTENQCCSQPLSNWDFFDGSASNDGIFQITVNGSIVVNASNTESGTFAAGAGDTVALNLTGSGPTKSLLVVDDTTGAILSNQTGTTGALTYTYTAPGGHVYTVVATQNPTTTTTTTTTTTSTTTTSTTSTSTTTTSTTTTTTTLAAGAFKVINSYSGTTGVSIASITPTVQTGATFPVAEGANTTGTISGPFTNVDLSVTLSGTAGPLAPGFLELYKNGALVETLGAIIAIGTYTFGPVSFVATDFIDILYRN